MSNRREERLREARQRLGFPNWHTTELVRPIACQGCRNYHGQTWGGNHLVCGMHPYGPEADSCDDWEDDWLKTLKSPAWFSNLDFSDRELWLDRLRGLLADSDPEFLGYRIMNGLEHAGVINHVELKAFIQEVRAGN